MNEQKFIESFIDWFVDKIIIDGISQETGDMIKKQIALFLTDHYQEYDKLEFIKRN